MPLGHPSAWTFMADRSAGTNPSGSAMLLPLMRGDSRCMKMCVVSSAEAPVGLHAAADAEAGGVLVEEARRDVAGQGVRVAVTDVDEDESLGLLDRIGRDGHPADHGRLRRCEDVT